MLLRDVDPAILPAAMPLFLRNENSVSQFVTAIRADAMDTMRTKMKFILLVAYILRFPPARPLRAVK